MSGLQKVGSVPDYATHIIDVRKGGKLRSQTWHVGQGSVQTEISALLGQFSDEMIVTNRETGERKTFRPGDSYAHLANIP